MHGHTYIKTANTFLDGRMRSADCVLVSPCLEGHPYNCSTRAQKLNFRENCDIRAPDWRSLTQQCNILYPRFGYLR